MARPHVRFSDLQRDPAFPRRFTVHRTTGDVAEIIEHITVSELGLASKLEAIARERGEPVRATPVHLTARDLAACLAKGKVAALAVVLLILVVACGRTVTEPEKACGWTKPTIGIVRNVAGDSVGTFVIPSRWVC